MDNNGSVQLLVGDCLETLKTLPDCSVQCCVTSPPFYGLRDYGTAKWEGGDPECDHNPQAPDGGDRTDRTLPLGRGGVYKNTCKMCGAVRKDSQIGLEETPEAYVAKLVAVFQEVKRVLKDDGTFWLNLGDSYNGSGGAGGDYAPGGLKEGQPKYPGRHISALKPKDLIGIPWMVAFALRADGWWLRSDIIWAKPNPMPESVTDRCTKSHEYIFLLTKSARYYYDAEAIAEPANYDGRKDEQFKGAIKSYDGVMPNGQPQSFAQNGHARWNKNSEGVRIRNKRDVWTVTTKPYREAHFATFPPDLIEPCILAGTSEKGECPKCGKAWKRVVEKAGEPPIDVFTNTNKPQDGKVSVNKTGMGMGQKYQDWKDEHPSRTTGWQPQCDCVDDIDIHNPEGPLVPVPQTVLDPFSGSGTTGAVSIKHGRNYVGCELNPSYIDMTNRRLAKVQPLLL